jgi:hypothetical protein
MDTEFVAGAIENMKLETASCTWSMTRRSLEFKLEALAEKKGHIEE